MVKTVSFRRLHAGRKSYAGNCLAAVKLVPDINRPAFTVAEKIRRRCAAEYGVANNLLRIKTFRRRITGKIIGDKTNLKSGNVGTVAANHPVKNFQRLRMQHIILVKKRDKRRPASAIPRLRAAETPPFAV